MSVALSFSMDGSVYADIECFAEYVAESHPTDVGNWTCKCYSSPFGRETSKVLDRLYFLISSLKGPGETFAPMIDRGSCVMVFFSI